MCYCCLIEELPFIFSRNSSFPSRPASIVSLDSFTSAVETSEQALFEMECEDFQKQFILLPSVLLSKYKSHLAQMHCDHWIENEQSPRKFNLIQNLKVCISTHDPESEAKHLQIGYDFMKKRCLHIIIDSLFVHNLWVTEVSFPVHARSHCFALMM